MYNTQIILYSELKMIVFDNVTKRFGPDFFVVSDLSFEVKEGETLVFLGRSGSGKTTALRLINRLIEPDSGRILLHGEDLRTIDPIVLRRQIGYAIQHIGLFPHMTVEENIAIVPKLLGWKKEKIEQRVVELLHMMGLKPASFRSLYPSKLSGGQKQRVGVARALAADPPIILMDEPFGALDPMMREQLQNEFLEIQSKIRKTIIFVTHDLSEAVKMGSRIAVLEKGKLVQIADAEELIHNPANEFIDQFLGKDRFQLLLQTKSIKHLLLDLIPSEENTHPKLSLGSTLMEALMTFKLSQVKKITIMDEEKYIGDLSRDKFVETVLSII